MNLFQNTILWAALSGAAGTGLLLPRSGSKLRPVGAVLAAIGLGLFAAQVPRFGDWLADSVFLVLALITLGSALAAITLRSPIYCAIWFALTLLGTGGLLLLQGAQLLGIATVVVYAGAILVTFLFVLMLAQPQGRTSYDRTSWEGWLSSLTAAALVGLLTAAVQSLPATHSLPSATHSLPAAAPVGGLTPANAEQLQADLLSSQHVARLGGQLFSKQLIGVEVAGTLLLAALVGAVAITSRRKSALAAPRAAPAASPPPQEAAHV